jgi:hypothetical protein
VTEHTRKRRIAFANDVEKWRWMDAGAHRDARIPTIVELASTLVRPYAADDWQGMATTIHRFVRDAIRYQHDPDRRERLADAAATLRRGADDCDGKARLAAALANAAGLEAMVWPVFKGPILGHVQWAAKWPGSERLPSAKAHPMRPGGPREWIVGDVTIRGCELGEDPLSKPRDPTTGRLPLA